MATHRSELSDLIYARSFELKPESLPKLWSAYSGQLASTARRLGLRLSIVANNLRNTTQTLWRAVMQGLRLPTNSINVWQVLSHGQCLAAIFHALRPSRELRRIYLPSSHTYDFTVAWASDALHDHLWSSDELEIIHDGSQANRLGKVLAISSSPTSETMLSALRVCTVTKLADHGGLQYNCGLCEKCLRTMVELEVAGNRMQAQTFEPISTSELSTRVEQHAGFAKTALHRNQDGILGHFGLRKCAAPCDLNSALACIPAHLNSPHAAARNASGTVLSWRAIDCSGRR